VGVIVIDKVAINRMYLVTTSWPTHHAHTSGATMATTVVTCVIE
jgi:hypothetical protein